MDPLTALSVAATIVQFVDLGCQVLSEGRDIYKSGDGTTKEKKELQRLTLDLEAIVGNLGAEHNTAPQPITKDEEELQDLAKMCQEVSVELSTLLERLVASRKRQVFGKAFLSVISKGRIGELQKRLDRIARQINTRLLYMLKGDSSLTLRRLDQFSHTSQQVASDQGALIQSSRTEVLAAMGRLPDHTSALGSLSQSLDTLVLQTRNASKSERIIDSLRFQEMRLRHANIKDAYAETFSWIFSEESSLRHWLQSQGGIFWVRGKAGSGKSTLVKYICDDERTDTMLKVWANGKALVVASFYFWNSGYPMQKSQEGLLQSLLWQMFNQCPELLPTVCERRWSENVLFHQRPDPWTRPELIQAFDRVCRSVSKTSSVFCFFIDGLDEYSGDHAEIIAVLRRLAAMPNVKVCASSRPELAFEQAFGSVSQPKLILEDLTRNDMRIYVESVLQESDNFRKLYTDEKGVHRFIETVVWRSDGVFLWVTLVLDSLLRGLVKGDDVATLRKRLEGLPTDLENLFQKILTSIEPIYQEETSRILQIATAAHEAFPLPVKAFWFLRKDMEDPKFALEMKIEPTSISELPQVMPDMKVYLKARCGGLLDFRDTIDPHFFTGDKYFDIPEIRPRNGGFTEIGTSEGEPVLDSPRISDAAERAEKDLFAGGHAGSSLIDTGYPSSADDDGTFGPDHSDEMYCDYLERNALCEVNFLHRSVRDFLRDSRDAQLLMTSRTPASFDPRSTICSLLLAVLKSLEPGKSFVPGKRLRRALLFLAHELEAEGICQWDLLFEMDKAYTFLGRSYDTNWIGHPFQSFSQDLQNISKDTVRADGYFDILHYAVEYDLFLFVSRYLDLFPHRVNDAFGYPPLALAFESRKMAELLLERGADPNAKLSTDQLTVWRFGLLKALYDICLTSSWNFWWPWLLLLLDHGADPFTRFERFELIIPVVNAMSRFETLEDKTTIMVEDILGVLAKDLSKEDEVDPILQEARARWIAKHNPPEEVEAPARAAPRLLDWLLWR